MKKGSLAIFVAMCMIAGGAMAQNLYTNSSFEDGDAFTVDTDANYVDGTSVPGWRLVGVSGATGNFGVVEEASAPIGTKVLQLARATGGQFQVDRWATSVEIDTTKVYKHSFWVRKISGEAGSLLFRPFAMSPGAEAPYFENDKFDYRVNGLTQNVWEKHETFMTYPAGAGTSCPYIVPESVAPTYQVDNFTLEDASLMDLCPNGRFENAARLVGWQTTLGATVARGMVGTITTDAANVFEGSQALNIVKTDPGVAGDALFRSTSTGWIPGHQAYLAFSVKNDPSIGEDSCIEFVLHSNIEDMSAEQTPFGYLASGETDGSYKRYEFQIDVTQEDLNKVYVDMRLRSNSNDDGTQEAAFVDFVSLGDLTVGGVPVEMSTFEIE